MELPTVRKGKVVNKAGEVIRDLTPEEKKEFQRMLRKGMEYCERMDRDRLAGVPSSKEGRDIFYSNITFFEWPLMWLMNAWCFLTGVKVWYSKEGCRCEGEVVNVDSF
jgi:hypothetical protein